MCPDRVVSLAEAKATLSELVKAAEAGETIAITKRGKPLAIVSPSPNLVPRFEDIYGSMAGTGSIAPGVDLTAPTIEDDWEEEMLKEWDEQNR